MGFSPQVVDVDGDGHRDLLSGSWPGELYVFRGTAGGGFGEKEILKGKDGGAIKAGSATVPFATDWDGDGDLDLLVGTVTGEVHLVRNEGKGTNAFGEVTLLETEGEAIRVPQGDAGPVAADWDEDGRLDLLVGTGAGSVLWYRNVGTKAAPELAAGKELVASSGQAESDGKRPWGTRAKICVADWNEDGRVDLLLGDFGASFLVDPEQVKNLREEAEQAASAIDGLRKLRSELLVEYRRERAPLEGEGKEDRKERLKRVSSCLDAIQGVREEIAAAEGIAREYEFRKRERHGWVWLFKRQPVE